MSSTDPSAPTPSQGTTPGGTPDFAAPPAAGGVPPRTYPQQPQWTPTTPYPGYTPQPNAQQPYPQAPYPQYPQAPYPQAPYPQQPYSQAPYPQQPYGQQPSVPRPEAPHPTDLTTGAAAPAVEENVPRGLLFSLGGILVGVVLTAMLWRIGFFASITSFAMAYATVWLYTKGAGGPPRKGVGAVIGVIVVGVVVSLASIVAVDALDYLASENPDAGLAEKVDIVVYNLLRPEVWQDYASNVFMFVIFAALGTFGLIRQLGSARRTR